MKKNTMTVKKLALICMVGCLSLGAFAGNSPEDNDADVSISLSGQHAIVVVRDWNIAANAPATIKVLDKTNKAVYEEAVSSGEQHARRYNFSQMEPGKYTLVLESKTSEVRRPFIVGLDGSVREDKSEFYQSFAPIVVQPRSDRASVYVAFKNIADAPLKLAVLNDNGEVLYSEEVAGEQEYNKKVNLKKLQPGSYTLALYNADYSFYKEVNNY
ncbi:MAG: hypothetical protein WBA23_09075 [Tunicatimonas sp.]|uniref:DUF3244 domain-containing protein n=1 Tax=Tunicatimonas sp. TaxID=1940096 RepID=UPI003C738A09